MPFLSDLLPGESRTVVITGGNRGIGFEAVKQFLDLGYKVIIGEKKNTIDVNFFKNFFI